MRSLNTYTEKLPVLGETVYGSSFEKSFGGKGANQAVQCQRLGVQTGFIGNVGSDSYGEEYLQHFKEEGISTNFIQSVEGFTTGIAVIWIDKVGNNSIIIVPGANSRVEGRRVEDALVHFPNAKIAVFQNEIAAEANRSGLIAARKRNVKTIFNPAPVSEVCRDMVNLCDILCVNEVELATISRKPVDSEAAIREACTELFSLGCQEIVVTFGSKGAYLYNAKEFSHFPAPVVQPVDTVGAGDSFIG